MGQTVSRLQTLPRWKASEAEDAPDQFHNPILDCRACVDTPGVSEASQLAAYFLPHLHNAICTELVLS
jgi:hypothetical protein